MATLSTSRFWQRIDVSGSDLALFDDRGGLAARGVAVASGTPLPYTCRYELVTDADWAVTRLEVVAEGAGWWRRVRLERTGEGWRVPTSEQGDLGRVLADARQPRPPLPGIEDPDRLSEAVDVDLAAAPLFNTVPVRRLGLRQADPGTEHTLTVAYVRLPSLEVSPVEQTYTTLGDGRVRFRSSTFTAELSLDRDGYVVDYPGLAHAVA